ncbi:phosphatidylglycerophosphatase A [Porphyromonadaceae bacterium OttesenSCG-928-L07]|nr:phosphatidylglycerophosphatase A [Porphyromonadaceae bacterium OttesenSCG-928-L07]
MDSEMAVAVIRLEEEHEVLSSAVLNGGHCVTDTLMIMEVPKMYDCSDPLGHITRIRDELGLPENTVGFMTAAEVADVATLTATDYNGTTTHAVATAGLSNIVTAGDVITDMDARLERSLKRRSKVGTINIIGIVPFPLSDEGRVNSFIVMTEAKTAALNSLGYGETGTTSDAIAICSPIDGNVVNYTGTGTDVGISLARSVRDSVRSALIKRNDFKDMGTFLDQLASAGVSRSSIRDAAFELYIPNPDWDTDVLKDMFEKKLDVYVKDINVSSLIQAAIELDRLGDKDCICAMERGMFATDPIHLVADEMLGMQLAQYIAGTRGIFEFHRFDRHKPGIIGELGPFLDDIICGLAGGIMSAIYTELFEVVQ